MDETTLNLDDLVANREQAHVLLEGVPHEYADASAMDALTRQRLNWLWRQVLAFETAESEPTDAQAERYAQQVDEAVGIVLPSIVPELGRLGWDAKSAVLLDFFTRRQDANREIERVLAGRRIGAALSPRSNGSTARATRGRG